MAPTILLALIAILMAGADDAPVATQVKPPSTAPVQPKAPAPGPTQPLTQGGFSAISNNAAPPSDDYGYVAWCYGALTGYIALYDQAMPEVTRIEREFPGPDGADEDLKIYPQLRAQAKADQKLYASAIEAAEKASPKPIANYGAAAARRGMAIWNGARAAPKAKLAQMWMSWSPPDRCEVTANRLKSKASVLGQALAANTPDAATLEPGDGAPLPKVTTAATNLVFQPVTPVTSPAPLPVSPVMQTPPPAPATVPEMPVAAAPAAQAMTAPPEAPVPTPPAEAPAAPVAATEPAAPAPMPPPMETPAPPAIPGKPAAPEVWYNGIP